MGKIAIETRRARTAWVRSNLGIGVLALLFGVGLQGRAQDCAPLVAGGGISWVSPTIRGYQLGVPPIGGRVDRAELEIVANVITLPAPATYQLETVRLNPGGEPVRTKVGETVIGTNVSSRTITIPLGSNFLGELEAASGTTSTQWFSMQINGTLLSPAAGTVFNPLFSRLKLWVTPTNAPVFYEVFTGNPPFTPGISTYFSVSAVPCATFQWRKNGENIPGATRSYLVIPPLRDIDQGDYTVVASNSAGSRTSGVFRVEFERKAPVLNPGSGEIPELGELEGRTFQSCFSMVGWPAPAVRWEKEGVLLPTQTNICLRIENVREQDEGLYQLTVSNELGVATGAVRLHVHQAPPVVSFAPDITVAEGSTIRFPAEASGGPPAVLFLYLNGTNISLPENTLIGAKTNHSGTYYFVATNALGAATSRVAQIRVVPAGPLDQWMERNPLPQVNTIQSIAAGNGRWMAVGDAGTVLTSTNGRDWTLHDRPTERDLRSVTFSGGSFYAVGDLSSRLASVEGREWDYRNMGPLQYVPPNFTGIVAAEGRYVAVGYHGVSSSADGVNWDEVAGAAQFGLSGVAYGNGVFVAVGLSILMSPDGINWSHVLRTGEMEGISFVNGQFVAVGDEGTILTSVNGIQWQQRASGTLRRLYEVTYGNGKYVAVGARGTLLSSSNAVTWRAEISGTPDRLEAVLFHDGLFVAAGENGTTITSMDGSVWTKENFGTTRDLDGLVVAGNQIVVVGKGGTILVSTNGTDYLPQNSGVTNDIHGVGWNGEILAAVGENGVILSSPDAINWTRREAGVTNSFKRVIYARNLWVAVATEGTIAISADATNWTVLPRITLEDLNDIAYGNGQFMIVGDSFFQPNGTLLRSEDGVRWEKDVLGIGKNLRAVTFANGVFLAAANDGLFAVSTNARTWEVRGTGMPGNLRDVYWENGVWSIVGNNGIITTSTNFISWVQHFARARENLHELGVFRGRSITIGNRGTILQSKRWVGSRLRGGLKNGRFALETSSVDAGELQGSVDLRNWTTVTNWAGAPLEYSEPAAEAGRYRFFRALERESE